MAVVILERKRKFQCTSCDRQVVTTDTSVQPRLHPCRALNGILAPFTEVFGDELNHSQQRHVVVEREDYLGKELVRTDDNGRPIMAVLTERADGSNDAHVFAATARRED